MPTDGPRFMVDDTVEEQVKGLSLPSFLEDRHTNIYR